jgi:hypothetical protein
MPMILRHSHWTVPCPYPCSTVTISNKHGCAPRPVAHCLCYKLHFINTTYNFDMFRPSMWQPQEIRQINFNSKVNEMVCRWNVSFVIPESGHSRVGTCQCDMVLIMYVCMYVCTYVCTVPSSFQIVTIIFWKKNYSNLCRPPTVPTYTRCPNTISSEAQSDSSGRSV